MRAIEYEPSYMVAYHPCDDCGGELTWWRELPHPGHNLATLYECGSCASVFTLADIVDGMVDLLPVGRHPQVEREEPKR